ncbi:MAG: Hsp20/alpha crystallin family protein [Bacteroidota bacterium]|jgi:HSP20 family protein
MLVRFDSPRTYNNLIENLFSSDVLPSRCTVPAMDIVEQENEIVVNAELPGVKKEDVKITFENDILTLSSEQKPAEVSEKATVLLKEIRNSGFDRSVKFGYEIDATKISAEMSDGVLTITLPKAEQAKPKQIEVKVK